MGRRRYLGLALTLLLTACTQALGAPAPSLDLGVLLPLHGDMASLGQEEQHGIDIAVDTVNASGGVGGRQVRLLVRDVTTREAAAAAAHSLRATGAPLVLGSYSSLLSIAAAHATAAEGMVYWETGAVADLVTGQGLPLVFRVGANGTNLGRGSATFAAEELAPRLGRDVSRLRLLVVEEHDPYGDSVGGAALAEAGRRGMQVFGPINYDAGRPDWDRVLAGVEAVHPDVLVLASYIPDGISFRRAMLARGVHVGALIGSTMAECGPDFGQALGADAVGVFASDRPTRGFNPGALTPEGVAAYNILATAYRAHYRREPGEEAISGFSSAWALLREVLPRAHAFDAASIAAAARTVDLPEGSLANGAGLKFSTAADDLGQNLRAASVVWQWQAPYHSVTVWPPVFATGSVAMVPLPR